MSTILPLEVIFGRSTWSLALEQGQDVRAFDPSPLFGIRTTSFGLDPHNERLQFARPDTIRRDIYSAPVIEQLPHVEGLLGAGWFEHDAFLRTYNGTYANYPNRIYGKIYFIDIYSPDGKFGIDEWGSELTPGYRFIKPFVDKTDGTILRPFDYTDITASWEEVFLTGECGSGGGSERPESGLLYPRKV